MPNARSRVIGPARSVAPPMVALGIVWTQCTEGALYGGNSAHRKPFPTEPTSAETVKAQTCHKTLSFIFFFYFFSFFKYKRQATMRGRSRFPVFYSTSASQNGGNAGSCSPWIINYSLSFSEMICGFFIIFFFPRASLSLFYFSA